MLGIRHEVFACAHNVPDEATIRDVLERLDATAFTAATGSWLNDLVQAQADFGSAALACGRRVRREQVVVDGKALRGTRHHTASGRARHLLAACTGRGVVLAQAEIDGKTSEISEFAPLLRPLDLAGVIVTADALHTQRDHAIFLIEEKNQPSLYRLRKKLPWWQVATAHTDTGHGHARTERRSLKVCSLADSLGRHQGQGLLFPHAAQAICITRKTRPRSGGRWKTVTVYAVTSLDATKPAPEQLAAWIRRRWQIEALRHIRATSPPSPSPPLPLPATRPPTPKCRCSIGSRQQL